MNSTMANHILKKDALTKMQTIIIIAIIIIAAVAGVSVYFLTSGPAEPIKIGVITPLSPPADYISGKLILKVAQIFVEYQNAKGGVLGRPLELVTADQTLDTGTAISHLARMVTEHKIVGLIGPWESSVALPLAEATERYPTIMFVTFSWADEITANHYKYVFRVGVANIFVSKGTMNFIKWAGYKKAVAIVEESPYGLGMWDGYVKWKNELYPTLELTKLVVPPGKTDYTAELLQIKTITPPPDVILLEVNLPYVLTIVKQLRELGITPGIPVVSSYAFPFVDPDSFWKTVGEAGVGLIVQDFASPYMKWTQVGDEFVKLWKEKEGGMPPVWIAWYWDCLRILVKAIEDTKSTDINTLAKYIEKIEIEGTTGTIKFENDPTPGSVLWHQWTGFTTYFFRLDSVGATTQNQIYPPR
jgi:branched-chain amino acid transport system substrate-binding protein